MPQTFDSKLMLALQSPSFLTADGAWGTMLMATGLPPGDCPERWNITQPQEVERLASAYVAAGALVIGTNSFGGNLVRLAVQGLQDRHQELNRIAAEISRAAAGSDVLVAASMGPSGRSLGRGQIGFAELYDAFSAQAQALEAGGADACCIETMMEEEEAVCAIRAVRENTRLDVLCSFAFTLASREAASPAQLARAAVQAGACVVGVNCGTGPEGMSGILAEMGAAVPGVPLLVRASAGIPREQQGRLHYPATSRQFVAHVPAWIAAGARVIGGCCGTTPAHIAAIAETCRPSPNSLP